MDDSIVNIETVQTEENIQVHVSVRKVLRNI